LHRRYSGLVGQLPDVPDPSHKRLTSEGRYLKLSV
jgi:hypothetical protein